MIKESEILLKDGGSGLVMKNVGNI